jgi:hypothetical protein
MRSIACRSMAQKEAPFVLSKRPSRRVAFGDAPQDEEWRELEKKPWGGVSH